MSISVDKDIPMPKQRARETKYPYDKLDIGDSFTVPDLSVQVVCNMNYRYGKKLSRKFVARSADNVVRVWRSA